MESKRRIKPAKGRAKSTEGKGRAESIDLSRLPELGRMKDFTEKFLGERLPSALECVDAAHLSFIRASALLDYYADAAEFEQEAGTRPEAIEGWVVDSVKLQLEMLYVANMRLREIHDRAVASGQGE